MASASGAQQRRAALASAATGAGPGPCDDSDAASSAAPRRNGDRTRLPDLAARAARRPGPIRAEIHIGDGVLIAFDAVIFAHDLSRHFHAHTRIGDNCFIGARAIVMAGVRIGEGCVVGAGSVVTRDVPAGCIVAGNPARILRRGVVTRKWGILADAYAEALTREEQDVRGIKSPRSLLGSPSPWCSSPAPAWCLQLAAPWPSRLAAAWPSRLAAPWPRQKADGPGRRVFSVDPARGARERRRIGRGIPGAALRTPSIPRAGLVAVPRQRQQPARRNLRHRAGERRADPRRRRSSSSRVAITAT